MTKEIRSPNIERCAGVGPPFRHSDFSILSDFVIRHRIWKLLVMKSLFGILPCVGSMNPVRLPLNRPSASAKAPADKWGIFSPTGGCVFTVRAKSWHGARDLSRRNAGPADPRWEIAMPFRQPIFQRTQARAPIAVPRETVNTYTGGEGRDGGARFMDGEPSFALHALGL